ncbi:abortive infection family protein [Paenibacillus amylolyticus]|uniref:Abortive infection family protein n=1 Tax=Paenibacillus amylolyticus TaxID=1451 RepID=A0ABD8B371_PAEAM
MIEERIQEIERLKDLVTEAATYRKWGTDEEYKILRNKMIKTNKIKDLVPTFIKDCRTLDEIFNHFKITFPDGYKARRANIKEAFGKVLKYLESEEGSPLDEIIGERLSGDNIHEFVQDNWNKALVRRETDPEGAITIASTLIEQTIKFILDSENIEYKKTDDLPTLYKKTHTVLNLSPDGHIEETFKQILRGCTSIIQGLGGLRNNDGDAHGSDIKRALPQKTLKPGVRHAELSVNLAGTMANFLISTWTHRKLK